MNASIRASYRIGPAATVAIVVLATGNIVSGQWIQRDHPLQPGWNAIHFEVDPAREDADDLFGALPISEVWVRSVRTDVAGPPECQDPDDPTCVPSVASEWDVWLPPSDSARVVSNLRVVRGGRVYLIRAESSTTLSMRGRPNGAFARWRTGFNLAGLHVEDDPTAAPTFAQYLAGSAALIGGDIYRFLPDGSLSLIADPATTKIEPGVGYWLRSASDTEYDGPVLVDRGSLRGVDFDISFVEHQLRFENTTPTPRTVEVTYISSEPTPSTPSGLPTVAGDVPVSWLQYAAGPAETSLQWQPLTTASWILASTGAASARASVRLGINRAGLAGAELDEAGQGAQYQGLLEVRDGAGFRRWVSLVGQVPIAVAASATASGVMARPGLYYGQVTVDQVQWVTAGARVWTNQDPNNPEFAAERRCFGGALDGQLCEGEDTCPGGTCSGFCIEGANADAACAAASECGVGRCSTETDRVALRPAPAAFTFPIILHLAEDGAYKLLREVTLLRQPEDDSIPRPARFVLATPACDAVFCDALEASSVQDGDPFARRIGSAAFSFDGDLSMTGSFSTSLIGAYTLLADDPLNPFRHLYHPDHDCDQLGECYDITRSFALNFELVPPSGDSRPGWGDQVLGGNYRETLTGLHRQPITVGGRFELQRVSGIGTLNAQ